MVFVSYGVRLSGLFDVMRGDDDSFVAVLCNLH